MCCNKRYYYLLSLASASHCASVHEAGIVSLHAIGSSIHCVEQAGIWTVNTAVRRREERRGEDLDTGNRRLRDNFFLSGSSFTARQAGKINSSDLIDVSYHCKFILGLMYVNSSAGVFICILVFVDTL